MEISTFYTCTQDMKEAKKILDDKISKYHLHIVQMSLITDESIYDSDILITNEYKFILGLSIIFFRGFQNNVEFDEKFLTQFLSKLIGTSESHDSLLYDASNKFLIKIQNCFDTFVKKEKAKKQRRLLKKICGSVALVSLLIIGIIFALSNSNLLTQAR